MRFLLDACISWRMTRHLADAGHNAVHVDRLSLDNAVDVSIFARAASDDAIVVTQDIDFEVLLLAAPSGRPSVILFRTADGRARVRAARLLMSLPLIEDDLRAGAIVVFEEHSVRVHRTGNRP